MGERLAIRATRMFDGERLCGMSMVLVDSGKIVAVDSSGATPPDDARVIDLDPGATLLPGLIDCHAHLVLDASPQSAANLPTVDDATLLPQMGLRAAQALRAGVTTIRDLGDRNFLAVELAATTHASDGSPLPEIIAAGPPITTHGGHFAMMGGEAEGPDELRAAVRQHAQRGCKVVKVMASGGNMSPQTKPWLSQYGLDDLRLIADEAHDAGMTVAAHAHAGSAIADACDAGIDTIEHASFFTEEGVALDEAVVARMASRGTFVSSTVGLVPGGPPPPPAVVQRMPQFIANGLAMYRAGVRVVLGPDSGIAPSKPHDVLPYAVEQLGGIGVSTVDALRAATSLAAAACGVNGRKGCIAAGADADLLILDGDPFADLAAIHNVAGVMRAGAFAVPLPTVASTSPA